MYHNNDLRQSKSLSREGKKEKEKFIMNMNSLQRPRNDKLYYLHFLNHLFKEKKRDRTNYMVKFRLKNFINYRIMYRNS